MFSNIVLILAYASLVVALALLFYHIRDQDRCLRAQHRALLSMRTELCQAIDKQSVLEFRLDDMITYRATPLADLPAKFPSRQSTDAN